MEPGSQQKIDHELTRIYTNKKLCWGWFFTFRRLMAKILGRVYLSMLYKCGCILKYALLLTVFLLNSFLVVSVSAKEGGEEIDVSVEIRKLKSKKIDEKLSAIERLGKARDKRATAELIKELKTQKNRHLKSKVIESLSNTKDEAVVPEIESVLKTEEDITVKSMAVIALGNIATDNAIRVLVNTVKNENEETTVRLDALEGLSRIKGNKIAFDTLVKATENKNPLIRRVAIGLLWQNFYPQEKDRITPIFQKMLQDPDEGVRNSVKQILEYKSKE